MKYYPRNYNVFDEMFDDFFPKEAVYTSNVMRTDVYEKTATTTWTLNFLATTRKM